MNQSKTTQICSWWIASFSYFWKLVLYGLVGFIIVSPLLVPVLVLIWLGEILD